MAKLGTVSLAPGGGAGGSTQTVNSLSTRSAPVSTGALFVNSLREAPSKIGPFIRAATKTWNDLDLFEIHSGNYMVLQDQLVYRIIATDGISSLTGVAAPKVAVSNQINTFRGRTFIYNVLPATDVPKRGTVRMMSKTVKEWSANMTQKGIGTHLEGGSFRTPDGDKFMAQELRAFAMAFELNMSLNAAITLTNAAIGSSFFAMQTRGTSGANPRSMAQQIQRELQTFCCACGDGPYLKGKISDVLETIPNANIIYMTSKTAQGLVINDSSPPPILPNETIAMIRDPVTGVDSPIRVTSAGIQAITSIFNKRLAVLPMPVFNFNEGDDRFQPLEQAFSCGELVVLNSEMGCKAWYELDHVSVENNRFSSPCTSTYIYDHAKDARVEITFPHALKYSHLFGNTSMSKTNYEFSSMDRRLLYDKQLFVYLGKFALSWSNIPELDSAIKTYANSTNIDMVFKEPMSLSTTTTKPGQSSKLDFIETVQSFKRHVQFPLTLSSVAKHDSRYSIIQNLDLHQTTHGFDFCLPNHIGDIDPMHLSTTLFMNMVSDAKRFLQANNILECAEYSSLMELRSLLTESSFDPTYWELVYALNSTALGDASGTTSTSNYSTWNLNKELANDEHTGTTALLSRNFVDFPTFDGLEMNRVPTYEEYKEYANEKKRNLSIAKRDYIPQGLYSVPGLRFLANSSVVFDGTRVGHLASKALIYLQCLWKTVSTLFPHSLFTNCGNSEFAAYFGNYGNRSSRKTFGRGASNSISESDGMQIVMNMLDEGFQHVVTFNTPDIDSSNPAVSLRERTGKNLKTSLSYANMLFSKGGEMYLYFDFHEATVTNPNIFTRFTLVNKENSISIMLPGVQTDLPNFTALVLLLLTEGNTVDIKKLRDTNLDFKYLQILSKLDKLQKSQVSYIDLLATRGPAQFTVTLEEFLQIKEYVVSKSTEPKEPFSLQNPLHDSVRTIVNIPTGFAALQLLFALGVQSIIGPVLKNTTNVSIRTYFDGLRSSLSDSTISTIEILIGPESGEIIPPATNVLIAKPVKTEVDGFAVVVTTPPKLLTSFVLYERQLPAQSISFMSTYDRSMRESNSAEKVMFPNGKNHVVNRLHMIKKFATMQNMPHTHWLDYRYQMFGQYDPNASHHWTCTDRLLSLFLLFTQFTEKATCALLEKNIRPCFEIVLFRPWMRGAFEAFMLMQSGIMTAFSPFTNAHIGTSRDGTTDQYQVRAVIETDCVVVNPQNLVMINCVRPTAYLGGRGTIFLYDEDHVMNLENVVTRSPSILAAVCSFGFMVTTDEPVSFINKPSGRIMDGYVDESTKTQIWPGAGYYAETLYPKLFNPNRHTFDIAFMKDLDNTASAKFKSWLEEQREFNHICFRGFHVSFDVHTQGFTRECSGTGHYGKSNMNDTGARAVFEGKSTTFVSPTRPAMDSYV